MPAFSCCDYTFPLLTRSASLELIRLLEFDSVDIGLFARSSHFSPAELLPNPVESGHGLKAELDRLNLKAADVFLQIGVEPAEAAANDPSAAVRENNRQLFERALDFAATLGCRHLTGLPGVPHTGVSLKADFELAASETAWRVEAAARAGRVYAVEAHTGSICGTPQAALEFVSAVPGLTLTLDYGHFIARGFGNEDVHPLCASASHFHARGAANGQLQATAAENTVDFQGAMEHLRRANYHGYICLEYVWTEWEACNRTDNISETILLRRLLQAAGNASGS